MATINLLDWREERRKELGDEFKAMLVLFALVGGIVVFAWQFILNAQIDSQVERNNYLKTHIKELDQQVAEIKELKKQKKELEARMEVIQSLQGNRPEIVHIFDEIVRTLPDGVFYKSIARADQGINLVGVAESNNRVSSLMRQFGASEWFVNPNLKAVKASPKFGEQANEFEMTIAITKPGGEEDKNKKGKKKR